MSDDFDVVGMEADQDFWGDGDLAAPKNLPVGTRFIGVVTGVEAEERTFANALKDGRTVVPMITVKVRAAKYADGRAFGEDENVVQTTAQDFWMGKVDKGGRHALANLVKALTGMSEDELKMMTPISSAKMMIGAAVTFEVKHRNGRDGGVFQSAAGIKAASPAEVEVMNS